MERSGPLGPCAGFNGIFADMHDGDLKEVTVSSSHITIRPYHNNQTWMVEAALGPSCTAMVDFNVPGKPSPPPVALKATLWTLFRSKQEKKSAIGFTDPSATLAPAATPLNYWIQTA